MLALEIMKYIVNLTGRLVYSMYDILLLTGVYVIFPFESYENKVELHNYCINTCNNYCSDICYDISWKTCEIITLTQIFYNKTLLPNFHSITDNYFRNRNEVTLIKNGEEIHQFKTWELFENEKQGIEYDLLLYTKYNDDENKKNYTLIGDHCIKNPNEVLSHKCDVNFIIFQLTNNNKKYDINLKDPFNFFIKDNILKYSFFKWYIKKVYDVELTEDFCVNYMTQDMSVATLHHPFFIKFNEDGITSFSSGKPKPKTKPILHIEIENENEDEDEDEDEDENSITDDTNDITDVNDTTGSNDTTGANDANDADIDTDDENYTDDDTDIEDVSIVGNMDNNEQNNNYSKII